MQQISNKTLTFLLVATIVISVGGTMISLNRINRLVPGATGMGTTGKVNVSIASTASVNIVDAIIQFGSCAPTATYGCNVSSNVSSAECSCAGGSWPDNITVQNDGNKYVNLTVKTTDLAASFIGGTSPKFWFSSRNATLRPGCYNSSVVVDNNGLQWDWFSFDTSNIEYTACANLTFDDANDQLAVFAKLFLPADAPISLTNNSATLTFTANALT